MCLLWFILGFAAGLGSLFSFQVWLSPRLRTYIKRYSLVPKFSTSASKFYDASKEQLHQNQQEFAKLRRVIQNAPIGYLEVNEDNRMSWCNKKACHLLGIQSCQDEVSIQRLLLQMVRSYELDQLIEQTRHTQKPAKQEWVFHSVAPDPLYPVEQQDRALRAQSIVLEDGHIGIFVVDRQEIANLTQQRDRWAADVAHELKTPLTSIRLIAEVLQGRLEPSLRDWVDRLLQEVIRLSNLVQDLLDLGQLDIDSSLKLIPTTIDLPQVLHSVWSSLEPIASERKVRLEYDGPDTLKMEADESGIHRLLLNLLDNSIKYSPSLQIILVMISRIDSDLVQIEVLDSGPGFPSKALPHVFDRFYRVEQSRSRTEKVRDGSGLGLAIVQQIVQIHKGTIRADNHPKTGGAWIVVELPLHQFAKN